MSSSSLLPGRGSMPAMHWCHGCGIEIRPLMTPGPTCPRCNGEFVEEIDASNPIANDDVDEEEEIPRPFNGAAGTSGQNDSTSANSGMDLGSLVGGILRGLASAGSQPRPTEYTQPERLRDGTTVQDQNGRSNGYSNVRTGGSQAGPVSNSWSTSYFQTSSNGVTTASGSSSTSRRTQSDSPFAGGAPLALNEFLRQSFDQNAHRHDDGMGGAGVAADGRFFNADNRGHDRGNGEGRIDDTDELDDEDTVDNQYPPEIASIRDVFANLFGGMGDGPASMLIDMFGGGAGSGRSGDYVWGQRGLDDVITQLMEQTRTSSAPPPASEEAIKRLERFSRRDIKKVRQARNRECSTCMDSFEDEEDGHPNQPEPSMDSNRLSSTYWDDNEEIDNDDPPEVVLTDEQQDELMMMPCKHLFHLDCLLPWLKTNGTCPVCRVSLNSEEDKNKDKQASGSSRPHDGEWSAPAIDPDSIDLDDVDDESPETIRERSRRAAEARMTGNAAPTSREQRQTVPGGYLQPDELD